MRTFTHAIELASHRACSEDSAAVFALPDGLVVAVADGAGGRTGGLRASRFVVDDVARLLAEAALDPWVGDAWVARLRAWDGELARKDVGETTAVVLAVGARGIVGASVGDSEAWIVAPTPRELTEHQDRKRLGSGRAVPRAFRAAEVDGVIVATDGFFRAVSRDDVIACGPATSARALARDLVSLAGRRSGTYFDDVTVVAVARGAADGP